LYKHKVKFPTYLCAFLELKFRAFPPH